MPTSCASCWRSGRHDRIVPGCRQHSTPHSLFAAAKRERAVEPSKRKNAWRGTCAQGASSLKCGGCSSGLPPKLESPTGARRDPSLESVSPALTPRRSTLEVEVKPALQAPLTLPWSANGNRRRGCPEAPNPRPHPGAHRDLSLESVSPALTPRRSTLEVEGKPALQAPLTLPWSASGNRRRGCPKPPNPRATHAAGINFPKI